MKGTRLFLDLRDVQSWLSQAFNELSRASLLRLLQS